MTGWIIAIIALLVIVGNALLLLRTATPPHVESPTDETHRNTRTEE